MAIRRPEGFCDPIGAREPRLAECFDFLSMSYSTRRTESMEPVKGFETAHGRKICMLHVDEASIPCKTVQKENNKI
jgi:hypothetical protein